MIGSNIMALMNVAVAARNTEEAICRKQREELITIENCIFKAIQNGNFEFNYYYPIFEKTQEELERNGYKVEKDFDSFGRDYIKISWGKVNDTSSSTKTGIC